MEEAAAIRWLAYFYSISKRLCKQIVAVRPSRAGNVFFRGVGGVCERRGMQAQGSTRCQMLGGPRWADETAAQRAEHSIAGAKVVAARWRWQARKLSELSTDVAARERELARKEEYVRQREASAHEREAMLEQAAAHAQKQRAGRRLAPSKHVCVALPPALCND